MDKVSDVLMEDMAKCQDYSGTKMTVRFHLACFLEFIMVDIVLRGIPRLHTGNLSCNTSSSPVCSLEERRKVLFNDLDTLILVFLSYIILYSQRRKQNIFLVL